MENLFLLNYKKLLKYYKILYQCIFAQFVLRKRLHYFLSIITASVIFEGATKLKDLISR